MSILSDNWLPNQNGFLVWTLTNILSENAKVNTLIVQDTYWWNNDLIYSIFFPFEARKILSIPLSFRLPEDRLVWHYTKDRNYSVSQV